MRVHAAAEPVIEVAADSPTDLLRIAWHIGNRHLPMQVADGVLRLRADHVIAGMVEGLAAGSAGATRRSTRKSAPMPASRRRIMAEPTATPGLYRLLAWVSPSFPTGAFSYSHGLEATVADGSVHDRASLQAWIVAVVAQGSGRIDADILRDALSRRCRW